MVKGLEEAIRKRAEVLGLSEEQVENILACRYSHLSVAIWRDRKGRTKKGGMQLKGYRDGRRVGLKLTTREELFRPMQELVRLYRAYKFFTEEWEETKKLLQDI